MATRYYCKACKTTFLGPDPVHFQNTAPVLPECPNSPEAQYFRDFTKPDHERDLPDDLMQMLSDSDKLHPVTLAQPAPSGPPPSQTSPSTGTPAPLASKPKPSAPPQGQPPAPVTNAPPSPWSGFKFTPPTEDEARELERAARQRDEEYQRQKNESDDRRLVQQLLNRIDTMISSGGGNKSVNFPKDLEYGTKSSGKRLGDKGRIITLAGQQWCNRGPDYSFRDAAYKKTWDEYQANFEKLIVSGDKTQGKHNVHVTRNG